MSVGMSSPEIQQRPFFEVQREPPKDRSQPEQPGGFAFGLCHAVTVYILPRGALYKCSQYSRYTRILL